MNVTLTMRMVGVFDLVADEEISVAVSDIVGTWRSEIEKRDRRLHRAAFP